RPCGAIERYLVTDPERLTHHVAFRLPLPAGCDQETFLEAVSRSSRINCPHVLPVEQFAFAGGEAAWIISPYTGDHDGLLLLSDLLADKGGQFEPLEVRRALFQMVQGLESVHASCVGHGELSLSCVLVDRAGKLLVELPGLRTIGEHVVDEIRQNEARSLVRIGYELLTGVSPGEQLIEPSRLVNGLSGGWDRFIREGLDPAAGYTSLAELVDTLDSVEAKPAVVEVKAKRVARLGLIRRGSGA
ncbi:MAG: hypothetical protein AAFS11_10925, partial [Planctomycetota bacterium]